MSKTLSCPECGAGDNDDVMGHENREVYDGVLFWSCLKCGHGWPREFPDNHRTLLSIRAALDWQAAREIPPD